jgi:hypothetical protein
LFSRAVAKSTPRTAGRLADAIQKALGNIGSATYRSSQACWKATGRAAGCSLAMADYPHEVIGGPPIESEADHFIHCPACGTWIDCRNLGELLAQEDWCTRDGNRIPMRSKH